MNRFFGIMPAADVEKCKEFRDNSGYRVTIEAGPKGWTIIWADQSTNYLDINDTTENNFKKAYDFAVNQVGPLREVSEELEE